MTVTAAPSSSSPSTSWPSTVPRSSVTELLDVGAAQAAGAHADKHAGTGRLRQVGELGQPVRVEDDRAHRPIVGGARGRSALLDVNRERGEQAGRDARR